VLERQSQIEKLKKRRNERNSHDGVSNYPSQIGFALDSNLPRASLKSVIRRKKKFNLNDTRNINRKSLNLVMVEFISDYANRNHPARGVSNTKKYQVMAWHLIAA
jgi:hypothetical protein